MQKLFLSFAFLGIFPVQPFFILQLLSQPQEIRILNLYRPFIRPWPFPESGDRPGHYGQEPQTQGLLLTYTGYGINPKRSHRYQTRSPSESWVKFSVDSGGLFNTFHKKYPVKAVTIPWDSSKVIKARLVIVLRIEGVMKIELNSCFTAAVSHINSVGNTGIECKQ